MKADEQVARDVHDAEFKEIQLRDASDHQPSESSLTHAPIYQAGNTGYSPQSVFSAYQLPQNPQAAAVQSESNQVQHRVLRMQKMLKWLSVADIVAILFFMVGMYFFLLVLLPLPLFGFFAARRLSRPLTICYSVWMCFEVLIRLVLEFVTGNYIAFYVINFLLIVFDIWVLVVVIRFFRLLGQITATELQDLKNGVVEQNQLQLSEQPQGQSQFQPQFQPHLQPQPQSQPQFQPEFQPQFSQLQSQYQPQFLPLFQPQFPPKFQSESRVSGPSQI
jgi:hypothetical protein